jgi:hypothetical protein
MSKSSNNSGIGATGLLGVAFVILKLCHVIDWKWIWVLCPFWLGVVILLIALLFLIVIVLMNNR